MKAQTDSLTLKIDTMLQIVVKTFTRIIAGLFIIAISGCQPGRQSGGTSQPYTPDWESLARHTEAPEWFADARFGIYFHWGVYSVPAYHNEWYPRWMHFEGHPVYNHHVKTYGHPSEFGYHDFVPLFKAANFDAERWAELFRQAGARFAGPVAEHHDGFAMWDSEITPWNAADRGPHTDITGALKRALEKREMKLITTFHHARNLQRYRGKESEEMKKERVRRRFRNSHYPLNPGMPPETATDGEPRYLYGNLPEAQWLEEVWLGKLKEVIDTYEPDIVWFDSWLDQVPERFRKEFCAYYLNRAASQDREVVIVRKQDDLPLTVSVDDLEKSRKNRIGEKVWMTDETISRGSWCYTTGLEIKPAREVLHVLIDIVSKNGVLLLNISPRSDGTIPANQREVLLEVGQWLERNGEAIYGTRPWYTYGEGPVKEPEGHFRNAKQFQEITYSASDIRYTTRGDVLYALFLGTPGGGSRVVLEAFGEEVLPAGTRVQRVALPARGEELEWALEPAGLEVRMPKEMPDEPATVVKIDLQKP